MTTPQPLPLRDGTTTLDRRLDRLVAFDEASRNFPVSTMVATKVPRSRSYKITVHLNQGQEGACAEFGCVHEMLATPSTVAEEIGRTITQHHYIYYAAQREDYWPGGAYPGATPQYEGTSVLHAVKQIVRLGYATGYRWAFGLADALLGLGYAGPGIAGMEWHVGMARPDANGFITPTGGLLGGHAVLVKAVRLVWKAGTTPANKRQANWLDYLDWDASFVTIHNSWGDDWADGGDCYLTVRNFDLLLAARGELVFMQGRKRLSRIPLS